MNPALATCAAGPPWLGPLSAVPRMVPPGSTATTARPGNGRSQYPLASCSLMSRSQENVSPAAAMPRMNGQIAGQSAGLASLISMPPSLAATAGNRD